MTRQNVSMIVYSSDNNNMVRNRIKGSKIFCLKKNLQNSINTFISEITITQSGKSYHKTYPCLLFHKNIHTILTPAFPRCQNKSEEIFYQEKKKRKNTDHKHHIYFFFLNRHPVPVFWSNLMADILEANIKQNWLLFKTNNQFSNSSCTFHLTLDIICSHLTFDIN